MPEIRQLSPSVINKIAAGEVIERPASVVKELVENSVDAGATRIDVTVEQGGGQLIRITDNGCGIRPEQLLLAVASHATSKIADADDLFRVTTFGFRGEALASIAEISLMRIVSRAAESETGAELEVHGGAAEPIAPCGCPVGTTIEVRNLFFNTPVRRKFLRSTQTELGHVTEALLRVALPQPRVHFTLRHNDRIVHDLPPVESWRERILNCFGPEVGESLIWVESRDDSDTVLLSGYVGDPSCSRANNRLQYLFLNGRYIRDRALQHALGEAYRGLMLQGRFPVAFLRLELPPDSVDVNVHPTKLEVRFQDGSRVYSQTLSTLRNKFLTTDLTARVKPLTTNSADDDATSRPAERQTLAADSPVAWARGPAQGSVFPPRRSEPATPPRPADSAAYRLSAPPEAPRQPSLPWSSERPVAPAQPLPLAASAPPPAAPPGPATAIHARHRGLQIHNRYLVSESDEGLVVIDQHALHERVLYEQLRDKILSGEMERQRLLVPEPVTLAPAEAGVVLDQRETLAELGIEIEPFGGDTVLVVAYPALLANLNPGEVLRQAVELLMSGVGAADRRGLIDELLHMMACKAAVKAGDRLSPDEVAALLEHRELCQDAHHCPHGRPTALIFTREELDKRFKRI